MKKEIENVIAMIAKKSASVEANTAGSCWRYQSKETLTAGRIKLQMHKRMVSNTRQHDEK